MRFLTVRSRFQSGIEHEFKQRSVTCPYSYPLQPPLTLLSWRRNAILRSYAANVSDPRTSYVPRLSPRPLPSSSIFPFVPFRRVSGKFRVIGHRWPEYGSGGEGETMTSRHSRRVKNRGLYHELRGSLGSLRPIRYRRGCMWGCGGRAPRIRRIPRTRIIRVRALGGRQGGNTVLLLILTSYSTIISI